MNWESLLAWDEMCDLDKGAALLHLWKVDCECRCYAEDNYPCEYLVDPRLTALDPVQACAHAQAVGTAWHDANGDTDEWQRLHNLALNAERTPTG